MALGSTQPLIERGEVRPAHKADNLTANCLEDVGASTSSTPMDLYLYWSSDTLEYFITSITIYILALEMV
jgi:hypothetical protein